MRMPAAAAPRVPGMLLRNGGGGGFVVGSALSIADIQLFDIVDLYLRPALFPEEMKAGASAARVLSPRHCTSLHRSRAIASALH